MVAMLPMLVNQRKYDCRAYSEIDDTNFKVHFELLNSGEPEKNATALWDFHCSPIDVLIEGRFVIRKSKQNIYSYFHFFMHVFYPSGCTRRIR